MRAVGACLFATLVCAASVVACSGDDAKLSATPNGTADGGSTDGAPPIGEIPPEPIQAEPASACPAGFDGPNQAPVAGENSGFMAGGQSRRFHLLLPPATFTGPRPLLFAFHGTTENGPKFIARAKLADFVARGFVVIAPDAASNGTFWPVWDAMRSPSLTQATPNPDVDLFDRLLTCSAAHFSIDKNRVFATGHSAGGIFTNRLLRSRSNVLAGGIVASGVFDLTSSGKNAPLDPMVVVVTWGGDNDTYKGTTPSGVNVPAFSFVEQASLASKFYDADPSIAHARCRGNNLGHAWLPLNGWFIDLLLSRPKGTAGSLSLAPVPPGAACSTEPYELAPLPDMTCPATARAGCTAACQLFADCAVENRTVGPSLGAELSKIGFTTSSCSGCVQRCQTGATTPADASALACFQTKQAAATCGPGIEGATPLFQGINECCAGKSTSNLCVDLCTTLNQNSAAKAFFPVCQQIVK